MQRMKDTFAAYASFGVSAKQQAVSSSAAPTLTTKNLTKWLKDAGVFNNKAMPGITSNDSDIAMNKVLGKKGPGAAKTLTLHDMNDFMNALAKDVASRSKSGKSEDDVRQFLIEKMSAVSGPGLAGTTGQSKVGGVDRLTDVKGYTGAHKERFDADTGKGKGREGREYVDDHAKKGYVKGYKMEGSYEKK